jgi:GLPGLI family protein
MRLNFLAILFVIIPKLDLEAQTEIYYKKLNGGKDFMQIRCTLQVQQNASVFIQQAKYSYVGSMEKFDSTALTLNPTNKIPKPITIKQFVNNKFYFKAHPSAMDGKKNLYVADSSYDFEYELFDSSKTILGAVCLYAQAKYRGRNYQIWYNPAIAISDGPYVFYGLPGLIYELKDTENFTCYQIIGIKQITNAPITVECESITINEYKNRLKKSLAKIAEYERVNNELQTNKDCTTCSQDGGSKVTLQIIERSLLN